MAVKKDENIIQNNHYYPLELTMGCSDNQGVQPYKYTGKELDMEHGLNIYDFEARQYDPAVGRFTTMDPLAEKYYSISPYAYCANNPVNLIDKDGRQPIPIPMPVPPPPIPTTTISPSDVRNAINSLRQSVRATFQIASNLRLSGTSIGTGGASILIVMPVAKSSPGKQEQDKREREARDNQGQREANVAKSIDTNITGDMPDGNPSPKRDPNDGGKGTKVAVGAVIVGGTARTVMELTNPDPSKDAAESHQEKAQQQPQQQQNNNQSIWERFKNWLLN